jgi:CO dehydrogenase maturation factor
LSTTIAVAGKGGTGKTTIAALLIRYLRERGLGPVLAIDADPSSNLNVALGLPLEATIGSIREEMLSQVHGGAFGAGLSKQDYLQYEIENALVESDGVDLLAMGRPEGPGCYCSANNMLRQAVDRLTTSYNFVVIDNEAGLEHLSRRTTVNVDLLLAVSDFSVRGLMAAGRVAQLVDELKTRVGRVALVINRALPDCNEGDLPDVASLSPEQRQVISDYDLELAGLIPSDSLVSTYDAAARPLVTLPPDSAIVRAVTRIADALVEARIHS